MSSPFGMAVPPASPFAGSLFKSRDEHGGEGQPVQPSSNAGSPFSTPGASAQPGLTVGDVLAQLPPELVRVNYLPSDQVISISQPLMDTALSNGQAAIPIFEIYRVCPALFQTPISPQDPRMVPLPAAKLPSMIATSQWGGQAVSSFLSQPTSQPEGSPFGTPQASPFGAVSPAVSGFGPTPPSQEAHSKSGTLLPPRREPGSLPFATMGNGTQRSLGASAFSMPSPATLPSSPFAVAADSPPAQSPFSIPSEAVPPAAASPFNLAPASESAPPPILGASPFGAVAAAKSEGPLSSLFKKAQAIPFGFGQAPAEAPPAPAELPVPPASVSPLGSPFGQSEPQPFALMEPPPPPAQPAPEAAKMPTSQFSPAQMAGPLKLSLASLLKGYSINDLGFDPNIVPSWIITTLSSSVVQEQMASGNADVELGLLIDGTSDLGFRNVLASAHRNVRIPLPANELFQGLPVPPAAQALSSEQKPSEPSFFTSAAAAPEAPANFTPPAPPAPSFNPPANPFAAARAAAIALSGPLSPAARLAMSGPIHPKADALFGFTSPTPLAAPAPLPQPPPTPMPPAAPIQPRPMVSFDPFAATGAPAQWAGRAATPTFPPAQGGGEGFSSDQLFGGPPAPMPPPVQRAEAPPLPAFPEPQREVPSAPPGGFIPLPGIPPPLPSMGPPSGVPLMPFSFRAPRAEPPTAPQAPVADHGQSPFGSMPSAPFGETAPSWASSADAAFTPAQPAPAQSDPVLPSPAQPASIQSASFDSEPVQPPLAPPVFIESAPFHSEPVQAAPVASAPVAPVAPVAHPGEPKVGGISNFGITQVVAEDAEQTMLRALLGVNEHLTVGRVVEIMAKIPGVAACSCVGELDSISKGGSGTSAQSFQKQAADLARSVQTLAPLIGIAGAETFSINTTDRLMTFSFHPPIAFGVLHEDSDLAGGLRDKITLVGRELSRLVTKNGGRIS